MTSSNYHRAPFSPPMYPEPDDNIRPVPPVRAEYAHNPQEEHLLPQIPERMDKPGQNSSTIPRQVIEEITDAALQRKDCSCNYNRYATKKTIGHGLFELALITSNILQFRTLLIQKQRDGIWITSLVLVCISILAQLGLAFILFIIGKGDIRDPNKQTKLEKYNNISLFITFLISVINVAINIFMSTANTSSYLDQSVLDALKNST